MGEAERVNSPRDISVAHTEAGKFWDMRFRGRILRENRETLRFASRIHASRNSTMGCQRRLAAACQGNHGIFFSSPLAEAPPQTSTSPALFGVRSMHIANPDLDNPPSTCDGLLQTCPKHPVSRPPPTCANPRASQPLGHGRWGAPLVHPPQPPLASVPARHQLWEALN